MALTPNERGFAIQTFSTSIKLLSQQIQSELTPTVTIMPLIGRQAQVVRQIAATEAQEVNGRLEDIIFQDTYNDARWVSPKDYDWATGIDRFEMLRTNVMPMGEYTQAAVAAFNRAKDREIIKGIFGVNATGERGLDSVVFDPNQVVGVNVGGSTSGMNVEKILAAKEIFMRNYAVQPGEMLTVVLSAAQIHNLMNDEQIVNGDYQNQKVLSDGRLTSVVGVNIAHSELLPVDSNGYRRNPMYSKSGVVLGIWMDTIVNIVQREDKRGLPWQIYAMGTYGATRTEEKKVLEILSAE
jgi:hypothetical protein